MSFGICLVTTDGQMFAAGDCDQPFTIQSISKPFTLGTAVEEFGHNTVSEHVGVEPSGGAFNSIELQNGSNRPYNPVSMSSTASNMGSNFLHVLLEPVEEPVQE